MPLDSTASAAAAQASSIQRRSVAEAGALSCASVKASTAPTRKKVSPWSSTFRCPTRPKYGLTASAATASIAAVSPYRRRTQVKVSGRQAKARPNAQRREVHSLNPNTR